MMENARQRGDYRCWGANPPRYRTHAIGDKPARVMQMPVWWAARRTRAAHLCDPRPSAPWETALNSCRHLRGHLRRAGGGHIGAHFARVDLTARKRLDGQRHIKADR